MQPLNSKTPARLFLTCGALLMALGVVLGAFGAHGLRPYLDAQQLATWQTAVQYHLIHALGLLLLGVLLKVWHYRRDLVIVGGLLIGGILLFSGSLYLLAVTGWRFLGPITPLGGVAFIAAWLLLAWVTLRNTGSGGNPDRSS